jgi:hypothetical protein
MNKYLMAKPIMKKLIVVEIIMAILTMGLDRHFKGFYKACNG